MASQHLVSVSRIEWLTGDQLGVEDTQASVKLDGDQTLVDPGPKLTQNRHLGHHRNRPRFETWTNA